MLIFKGKTIKIILSVILFFTLFIGKMYAQDISPEMLYLHAILEQKQGNHMEALGYFNQVIKLDRKASWAYVGKGECHVLFGEYGHAIKAFKTAVSFLPDRTEIFLGLAEAYEGQSAWEQAKDAYIRVIEIDPELMGANHNLGLIYFELEDWNNAFDSFAQELVIDPFSPETYYMVGLAYSQIGDWTRTITNLKQAAEMPGVYDFNIYNSLGFAYRKLGKLQEAEKAYKKARYLMHNKLIKP